MFGPIVFFCVFFLFFRDWNAVLGVNLNVRQNASQPR